MYERPYFRYRPMDLKIVKMKQLFLSKSKVGLFLLNSSSTLEGVRWASDELENKFMTVVKYLAQKGDMKPVALFDVIASFCLELGNDKKRFYQSD